METALHDKILSVLDRSPDMTIATVRPDGAPQATVVSFVHDGLDIYFGTGAGAQKAANIARDPRVSITVTAPYGDWLHIQGLSLSGVASTVTSAEELARVYALMVGRFPQLAAMSDRDRAETRLFRVVPTVVSVLDYTKGFGHTDLVTVGPADGARPASGERLAKAS